MNVGGNEQGCTTDATRSATGLHPVPLHALHQAKCSVGHSVLLLPGELLVVAHQLVYKAVNVQTWVNGPAILTKHHRNDYAMSAC